MKALSLQQPWAWVVANGYKKIENRKWNTHFRGEFFIHASKTFDYEGYQWIEFNFPNVPLPVPESSQYKMGGLTGRAHLIDVVTKSDDPWFFGPYGFILDGCLPIGYRPMRGYFNFFEVNNTGE